MESQSLPRCTGGVGGTGNLTLRQERDRLSEIRLETDTVARSARLGMRLVPLGITSARCGGLAPSVNYV